MGFSSFQRVSFRVIKNSKGTAGNSVAEMNINNTILINNLHISLINKIIHEPLTQWRKVDKGKINREVLDQDNQNRLFTSISQNIIYIVALRTQYISISL